MRSGAWSGSAAPTFVRQPTSASYVTCGRGSCSRRSEKSRRPTRSRGANRRGATDGLPRHRVGASAGTCLRPLGVGIVAAGILASCAVPFIPLQYRPGATGFVAQAQAQPLLMLLVVALHLMVAGMLAGLAVAMPVRSGSGRATLTKRRPAVAASTQHPDTRSAGRSLPARGHDDCGGGRA